MGFTVTVLGSSGTYSTLERACSGYLVQVEDKTLWLDAGGGTWVNLLRKIDYHDVDGILLTHRHQDHVIDLFQAFHARQYGEPDPLPSIPLWAPQETLDHILGFTKMVEESFDLTPIGDGQRLEFGAASLSFVRMAHPVETLGVRVASDDAVLAYSADSGDSADFQALAAGADLFVCEATFQESDELWEGHLRAGQAGRLADLTGVGRLMLTHLPPGRDLDMSLAQARDSSGDVEVELAVDLRSYTVGS